jgi:outer membrane protein assembly factor BamB
MREKMSARRKIFARKMLMIKSFAITFVLLIIVGGIGFCFHYGLINFPQKNETVIETFAEIPIETPPPTPEPVEIPEPTPEPTPTPQNPWEVFEPYATEASCPENMRGFRFDSQIEGELYPIHFGMPYTYSNLGITTFRGNNFRNTATLGTVQINEFRLQERFQFRIGSCAQGRWTGVGWTGQPSIVKWCFEVQQLMNLHGEHKNNPDLVEVIYGTLDGNVYFFDLENGEETRPRIRVGAPIKGAVTIDPRGYPLLYVGQGDVGGGRFGYYIYSLIDGSELFFLNGNESIAPRRWGAFDSNPLFDSQNDRMILCGENGVVYNFLLNTNFDRGSGNISIEPVISRYWYHSGRRLGIESSPSALGHYLFTADNSGLISCVNLKTFEPVWVFNAGDDTDSTMVAEWNDDEQRLFLYTATQVDIQGHGGNSFIRKLDATNGTEIWLNTYRCLFNEAVNGGVTASPVLGENDISDLVIFWVAMVVGRGGSGALVAFDKTNGEIVWENIFPNWGWSSPVAVYTDDGTSYLIVNDSAGNMHLLRGTTGEILYRINLGGNIEGSPAVFGNMLVVGTRGQRIFGIEIL